MSKKIFFWVKMYQKVIFVICTYNIFKIMLVDVRMQSLSQIHNLTACNDTFENTSNFEKWVFLRFFEVSCSNMCFWSDASIIC